MFNHYGYCSDKFRTKCNFQSMAQDEKILIGHKASLINVHTQAQFLRHEIVIPGTLCGYTRLFFVMVKYNNVLPLDF